MLRLAPKCHAILKRSTLGSRDFEKQLFPEKWKKMKCANVNIEKKHRILENFFKISKLKAKIKIQRFLKILQF